MNTSVLGFRKTPVAIMSMDERRQVVSRFSVENFMSHSVKKIRSGESFSVSLFSGIKKIHASEVYVRTFDFLSKIFSHSADKIRRGTFSCFTNFGDRKSK